MRYLFLLVVVAVVIIAPNLLWMGTSTVRIDNDSDTSINYISYTACEKTQFIGTLRPHQSVFRFLEACGDDTLEILIGDTKFCQTYVEGELYHVDATIRAIDNVTCKYDDLLSSLFIAKALWFF